ncbi:MAG: alpha/beta fold hydrolase [Rhodomicrobium sp.]
MRRLAAILIFFYSIPVNAAPALIESQLQAPGPIGALRGTMLAAENSKGPAVIIIPGSGPTDRDGNNPLGIKGSPYKLLATGLAAKGITTVRIDKRGMFGSRRAAADPNAVTIGDYAGDVHNWIKVIRSKTGGSCVWVAGHSEGGLVALASSRSPDDICGLILLASPGRPVGEVLREQAKANLAHTPLLAQALSGISALEKGRHVDARGMHPALLELFRPEIQGFLISMLATDPGRLAANFHKPILIMQGERDIQVSLLDAQALKQAAPYAKLVLLPDTNHVLKTVTSPDRAANLVAYQKANLPLAPGIVDGIAEFIYTSEASR